MKKGKSELVLVIDRSGSMDSIKKDMEGALSAFIKDQKKLEGHDIRVTYYKFDDKFEKEYEDAPLANFADIYIQPRGGTALLDALAMAIDEVGARLAKVSEDERPETVQVIVVTDGEENSSKKFSHKDVTNRIQTQEKSYSWLFTYLGANQDAIKAGQKMGFTVNNSITFDTGAKSIANMSSVLSHFSSGMRYVSTGHLYGCTVVSDAYRGYTPLERSSVTE